MARWQPIETAPQDEMFIYYWPRDGKRAIGLAYRAKDGGYRDSEGNWNTRIEPTHWMPLPPAPKPGSPKITINRRYGRAQQLLGSVLHIVGRYVCDHSERNLYRECAVELSDLFLDNGVQIITDSERAEAGLPRRDENGMTEDELQVLENNMLKAMRMPHVLLRDGTPIFPI